MRRKKILAIIVALVVLVTGIPFSHAKASNILPAANFTQSIPIGNGVRFSSSFDMVYVQGGTFTLGWQSSSGTQPSDTATVSDVRVDDFFIGETEVTQAMWRSVMGQSAPSGTSGNNVQTSVTWYDVHEFLARLYILTGLNYRLATEAEWEYAAKGGVNTAGHTMRFSGSNTHSEVASSGGMPGAVKRRLHNHLGIYDMSGNAEEWVWNIWSSSHSGGANPTGPGGHHHNQRTRRGGSSLDGRDDDRQLTVRQIRSIDGSDGGLGFRIALSRDAATVPTGMTRPMNIRRPAIDDRDTPNSNRDPRWVTGSTHVWTSGANSVFGDTSMRFWDTGEFVIERRISFNGMNFTTTTTGQWYSINNIAVVLVTQARSNWGTSISSTRIVIPYIFMDYDVVSVINDRGFTEADHAVPFGRFERVERTTGLSRPTISNPAAQTVEQLIAGGTAAQRQTMINMDSIPSSARGNDSRLITGSSSAWYQGFGGGGIHRYRKDITASNFRHGVFSTSFPNGNILANGSWFTVNDAYLRITQANGSVVEYLYAISPDGNTLYHVSFMDYERGDFRTFNRTSNSDIQASGTAINQTMTHSGNGFGNSTFREDPPPDSRSCPGNCGNTILGCTCGTPTPTATPLPTSTPTNAAVLSVSNETASAEQEVDVTIIISNNPGFASAIMRISFPDEFTLTNIKLANESLYENFTEQYENNLTAIKNHVLMGWIGRTEDITLNGELITLTFKINQAEQGNYPITIEFENIEGFEYAPLNAKDEPVAINIVNGTVTIQASIDYIVGDLNGDGRITSADSVLFARWLASHNVEINLSAANTTCSDDAQPSIADLTRLSRALVGHFQLCPHGGCNRCR